MIKCLDGLPFKDQADMAVSVCWSFIIIVPVGHSSCKCVGYANIHYCRRCLQLLAGRHPFTGHRKYPFDFTMTSQPENEPVPSASESIQPTDPNTVAEPVNSSSTSTSPSAATAAAAVAPAAIPSSHAHPAFPSLPQPGKLPSTPQEIHEILSLPADQFTAKGLPLLAKVADGKPFEGASSKAWERRNAGEQLLTLYEAGDQVYETTDERVKDIGGGLVYVLYVIVYLWCFESYIGCWSFFWGGWLHRSARLNLGQGNPVIWSDKMLDFAINLCELADPVQLGICHQRGMFY